MTVNGDWSLLHKWGFSLLGQPFFASIFGKMAVSFVSPSATVNFWPVAVTCCNGALHLTERVGEIFTSYRCYTISMREP